jgi:hypothetical protein
VVAGEEPTEGETIKNNNLGWNSGAESVVVFDTGSIYEFFPYESSVGIVSGVSSSTLIPGYGFMQIEFAFLFDHGTARVVESGVLITDRVNFAQGDKFGIAVVDGFVRYYKNDVLVHESSKSPSNRPLKVDLSFYAAGDQVDNASVGDAFTQGTTVSKFKTTTVGAGAKIEAEIASGFVTGSIAIDASTNLIDSAVSTGTVQATGVKNIPFAGTTSNETFSTVSADGDFHYATSEASFEPLETFATEGVYAESTNSFQPMETEVDNSNYTPKFALVATPFAMLTGWAHGLTGQISVSSDMSFEEMDTIAADHAYGEAENAFQPMSSFAFEAVEPDGYFFGDTPAFEMEAFGNPSDLSRANLNTPTMTLTAHGGGVAELTAPTMTLTIQGTLEGVGRLNAIMPRATLTASGTTGAIGSANLFAPEMTLVAFSGAGAELKAPSPYVVTASGVLGAVGNAVLQAPTLTLVASGTAASSGTAELETPRMFMLSGIATLTAPTMTLVASDVVSADTINHVFVINKELGEATEYFNYPASFLGTLSRIPLMIDSSGINTIGGTKDDTAGIDWFVEFAASDFGTSNQKRPMGIYLGGEGDSELYVTVRTGDSQDSANDSDNRYHIGANTRRVKPGKGIKGRYMGIRIDSAGGAPGSIASVEYLLGILERRR